MVLVILAILAALLVPALLGYIDRAKNQEYILIAESVEKAIQSTYAETYADGYEIVQCRSDFRTNGSHYNEKLFFYDAKKVNCATWCDDESFRKEVIDRITSLCDLGDYRLVYFSFSYNHSNHMLCANKGTPGIAGQSASTIIKLAKKDGSVQVNLYFDDATNTWQVQ